MHYVCADAAAGVSSRYLAVTTPWIPLRTRIRHVILPCNSMNTSATMALCVHGGDNMFQCMHVAMYHFCPHRTMSRTKHSFSRLSDRTACACRTSTADKSEHLASRRCSSLSA
jgi:hypothetical protein